MKKKTRIAILCAALMMLLASVASAASGVDAGVTFASEVAYNVNAQRTAIRVGSLQLDSSLNECARILALEMEGGTGDEALRPNGKAWTTVLDEQGYYFEGDLAARNRYTSQTAPDSTTLVEHWLATSGLRTNTLNYAYTHTGVYGYYSQAKDTYYVVQLFAKPARVEPAGYVAIASTDMYVYSRPTTSSAVVWALNRGAEVTIQSTIGSWARFAVSGSYGYAPLSNFYRKADTPTPTPTPTQPPGSTYYASANVNVRSGPGTQYTVVGSLSSGQAVTVTGSSGTWYRINWNRSTAYVSASYLNPAGTYVPAPTPPQASTDGNYYATAQVNVRSGPSTGYSIVGTLDSGDRVTVTGSSGNWYRVNWNTGYAYVSASYLLPVGTSAPTQPPATSGSSYYATANVNVRSGPSTRYSVVGGLSANQRVTVTGSSGNWYRISWSSGSAYVSASYLRPVSSTTPSAPSAPGGGTIGRATANVNIRSGPSTSYKRLGTLYKGELVTIKGYEGNWARVEWRDYASAYVSRSYLTTVR